MPKDGDGDGVLDNVTSASTRGGRQVDASGCSLPGRDGDGVTDEDR
jgi:hypothetical protein